MRITRAPRPAPTPIPAFAPVAKPLELAGDDNGELVAGSDVVVGWGVIVDV